MIKLKHWSFMMCDTFPHSLQDVKISYIHQNIEKYQGKLSTFKTNTKVCDIVGIRFPVPDYTVAGN